MAPLVRFALALRRVLRGLATLGITLGLAGAVVLDAVDPLGTPQAIAVGLLLLGLLARSIARRLASLDASVLSEVELGCIAMVTAFALAVRLDGSLDGDFYPAVFVCLALVGALARPAAAFGALVLAAVLEATIRIVAFGADGVMPAVPHVAFMVIFTGLNAAVLRTEIARVRNVSAKKLDEETERVRNEARNYRLLGAPSAGDRSPEDAELRLRSGVEEIHQSVLFALRLVREALGLHTAMLLWQNDAGTHLRISELVSDAGDVLDGPFLVGDGIFGAAASREAPVSLGDLKSSYQLPYYAGPCPVRAVSVVPVFEHGKIRGIFVADRVEDRPFTPREEAMLQEAASYAVRAIHNERVFLQLERAKVEQGKLYRAAEALGSAKAETEVIDAGVQSAREITSVDYAAFVLYDEAHKTHEVRAVSGDFEDAEAIVGTRFRHNTGLVSMALENRHPLPYRGVYDDKKQVVFTRNHAPPSMPSILVLPLFAHDRALGTLVLGSRRRGAFNEAARNTLEVLASHMAVSLEGARMLRRLEELATTDGLTGLLNKRAMIEVAEQKIASAKRFGKSLSVLVTDIDFFKKVNDTYGHDVGDVVIKGLGDILRRMKRTTDAVARFGGEEFVVVCEQTDEAGALNFAERVRQELARTTFIAPSADGKEPKQVRVTCSIGVATFPAAGSSWETMFKAADVALYASKTGGRDRTTVYQPGRGSSASAA